MAKSKKQQETIEVLYDKNGESVYDDKNIIIYAKYSKLKNIDKFYCLFDRNGALYNFGGGTAITFSNLNRYMLRSVSEKCFENYLTYLMTRKEKFYKFANRRTVENG